jgi:hypothetical protein
MLGKKHRNILTPFALLFSLSISSASFATDLFCEDLASEEILVLEGDNHEGELSFAALGDILFNGSMNSKCNSPYYPLLSTNLVSGEEIRFTCKSYSKAKHYLENCSKKH